MKKFVIISLAFLWVIRAQADIADPQKPATWQVTANEYQYSMTITTALVFNMEESRDVKDKIAAFVGDDCRGVAQPITYVPEYDRYLAHLLVYSNNINGDSVTLYMYDDSEGKVVEVAQKLVFAANATYGSTDDPYLSITTYDVTFRIMAENDSLAGAKVVLDDYEGQTSDKSGKTTFKNVQPADSIPFSVNLEGYDLYTGKLSLQDQDVEYTAYLTLTRSFLVTDGVNPLATAQVTLDGYGSSATDENGMVSFSGITPADSIYYKVELDKYDFFQDSIAAAADLPSLENVQLDLTTYAVTFLVTDSGSVVNNASVLLDGYGIRKTNSEGVTLFEEVIPSDSIAYEITTPAYDFYTGSLTVTDENITEEIDIDLTAFDVFFQVTNGMTPLVNATVELEGYGSKLTDVYGNIAFTDVILTDQQEYLISSPGYYSHSGSFPVVDQDISIKQTLSLKAYNVLLNVSDKDGALSDTKVSLTINEPNQIMDFITDQMPQEMDSKGNATWTVETDYKLQGEYAVQSGQIYDNQSTKLILERETRHGYVSFYGKVSSETTNDYLAFYIDGEEKGRWSGEMDWTLLRYEVEAGEHLFEWVYRKDGLRSSGKDCAWIDYIVTPASQAKTIHTTTNENGLAEFYNISPLGKIFYRIESEYHEYLMDTIDLPQQQVELDIELIPVYNLSFQVISDMASGQNPIEGVKIHLPELDREAYTDFDGFITFPRVSISEDIAFQAEAEGYELFSGSTAIIDQDHTQSITLSLVPSLEAANLITPNGDNINDYWEIFGVERYKSFMVYIYSAAGELIYQTDNYPENPWDGRVSGSELPDGIYYYILKNPDHSIVFNGIINLLN